MYISTRSNFDQVSAATAVKLGMVPAGGLFVPEKIPRLSPEEITALKGAAYQQIAGRILSLYLDDYSPQEIETCIDGAYNQVHFFHPAIAPLSQLDSRTYILELWHGPTAAFKDMALQIMPHLLALAIKKSGSDREVVILVATSGDTGKAALEGFKNVPGIRIIVFYPYRGVSKVQELQMTTTDGDNTYVVAVKGNFDDCQSAVKQVFGSRELAQRFAGRGYELSSANSINWGRLLPQIVYYFSSYARLLEQKSIQAGEKINFVVPTGNFGNILAGWYAKEMGLPVNKLICASNDNKVLTDFLRTGKYDKNRAFIKTISPSMDILISSNLERFLFEMAGHDGNRISEWMRELNGKGEFRADAAVMEKIGTTMAAGFATEQETRETIREVFLEKGYTLDPHTAVGVKVYGDYVLETNDRTVTVIAATASPFKFNASVLEAIKGREAVTGKDEFQILEELSEITGQPIHPGLQGLEKKRVLHRRIAEKTGIVREIEEILGITP